jgi:DNA-binding NtrC family response regulator
MRPKILVVDDDPHILVTLQMRLESLGYEVLTASDGEKGMDLSRTEEPDVIMLDLRLPVLSGWEFLKEIKQTLPMTEVIILTAEGSIEGAVNAIKEGAYDYLTKPLDSHRLRIVLEKALERGETYQEIKRLRQQLKRMGAFGGLIGNSRPMQGVFKQIEQVAPTDVTVMITGESGTGKERVARTIHDLSPRRAFPFVAINCAAIPAALWESEVLGHEKGSFTGAGSRREGCLVLAHRGTLFLDEVTEMSLDNQAKFLRVLENQRFRRLGGTEEILVNVRFIAATNMNLQEAVRTGKIREDFYYRLNIFTISLPPLRNRTEDIPLLAQTFLEEFSEKHKKTVRSPAAIVQRALCDYAWPGNIRELRNVIERAVIICRTDQLALSDLQKQLSQPVTANPTIEFPVGVQLADAEKELLLKTLTFTGGNKSQAAKILGISLKTLYNKLERYGLPSEKTTEALEGI